LGILGFSDVFASFIINVMGDVDKIMSTEAERMEAVPPYS
jgi:hypothetical protein